MNERWKALRPIPIECARLFPCQPACVQPLTTIRRKRGTGLQSSVSGCFLDEQRYIRIIALRVALDILHSVVRAQRFEFESVILTNEQSEKESCVRDKTRTLSEAIASLLKCLLHIPQSIEDRRACRIDSRGSRA